MEKKNITIMFLMALTLVWVFPYQSNAQNVFPDQTPAQEYLQNAAPQGPLKAGGGTGTGDGIGTGGGSDGTGNQNDTDSLPVTDTLWLLCSMAIGYGIVRKKQTTKSPKGDLIE